MMSEEKQKAALAALNLVLVFIRSLAYERAPYEVLAKALDTAELLPTLIVRDGDLSSEFRGQLEDLVALDERFGVALAQFSLNEDFENPHRG